jgi:death-on-curing protein
MSEPSFLTVDQVERLHENLIDRFGGSHGLRDRLLFEGAVLHPRNVYYYAQGDLFDVAAAYAFHSSAPSTAAAFAMLSHRRWSYR